MLKTFRSSLLLAAIVMTSPLALPAQSASRQLDSRAFIDVARVVLPSVVNISVEMKPRGDAPKAADDPDEQAAPETLMEFYMQQRPSMGPRTASSGSGVVVRMIEDKGYVVTNNHVIESLDNRMQLRLTFHQQKEGSTDFSETTEVVGEATRIIGRDRLSDLAVIEFDVPQGFNVSPIEWADSDLLEIGENIVALGNPLDLNHTVTTGIISGKSRYLGQRISLERLLQTNAVIQPGNSGGPLVNLDGKIVGINNAIASANGLWQGTSFAIPSNDARRISDQLIDRGRVSRGYLGVNMRDVYAIPAAAEKYGIGREQGGVMILNVVRNSPADIAGVHVEDVVIAIDGESVRTSDEMLQSISRKAVDAAVEIEVLRLQDNGAPVKLTMTAKLGERPDETVINQLHEPEQGNSTVPSIQGDPEGVAPSLRDLGMALEPWYDKDSGRSGLLVNSVAPGSAAEAGGVKANDVIGLVNGRSVRTIGDFRAALAAAMKGEHTLQVLRGGVQMMIVINN